MRNNKKEMNRTEGGEGGREVGREREMEGERNRYRDKE